MPSDTPESGDYIVDGDIVIDTKTSLHWEREDPDLSISAADLGEFCEGLELGGFDDWRTPTVMEWITILDYSGAKPTIAPVFEGAEETTYFASTAALWNENERWYVDLSDGRTGGIPDAYPSNVRCVRGGVPVSGKRFTTTAETVVDTRTLLEWERQLPDEEKDFAGATSYCEDLVLAGHDDWRLPGVKELASLLDLRAEPAIDPELFPGPIGTHWSAREANASNVYGIDMNFGWIEFMWRDVKRPPRCVRDWKPEP